jgi:ABC-2 type transport system ATP-binding protein
MNPVLEIYGVQKHFRKCEALRGVDMSIPPGQIVGLLGPNASGKTTLLKTIAGLYQPTVGMVVYQGSIKPGPEARKTIGFCPDVMTFPHWMRVRQAFKFYEEMYPDFVSARAEKLMDTLELADFANTPIHRLSKGFKERLMLALTYSRETSMYLLDEPLDGIDPVGKTKVIDTILAMQPEGSSTLVSTHAVKDIERIFDCVYFLSKGQIVFYGVCDTMRAERGQTVEQAYLEVFIREGSI